VDETQVVRPHRWSRRRCAVSGSPPGWRAPAVPRPRCCPWPLPDCAAVRGPRLRCLAGHCPGGASPRPHLLRAMYSMRLGWTLW